MQAECSFHKGQAVPSSPLRHALGSSWLFNTALRYLESHRSASESAWNKISR